MNKQELIDKVVINSDCGSDWFERGELPPVGWKGEYRPYWHGCEVVAYHKGFAVVWDAHDLEYFRTNNPEIFRPIKSDKEKFVELTLSIADKNGISTLEDLSGVMYDAGCRFMDNNK